MTEWNNSEIGRRLAVAHTTVMRWREALSCAFAQDSHTRTVTRGGTTYTMEGGKVRPKPRPVAPTFGGEPSKAERVSIILIVVILAVLGAAALALQAAGVVALFVR